MGVFTKAISFITRRSLELIDITERVLAVVKKSPIKNGLVLVYASHTTAAIKINESEPCLLKDIKDFLRKIAPPENYYRHNDFKIRTENIDDGECANAHSHCLHLLMGSSETLPLIKGKIVLGKWQRIFLIELSNPRKREVTIQVVGD